MMDYLEIQLPRPPSAVGVIPGRSGSADATGPSDTMRGESAGTVNAEPDGLRSAHKALQQAGVEFREIQEQFIQEAQQQLLGLALEIAKKVLMQEIQADRHKIDPIVTEALSRVQDRVDVVVHLHPDDLARCELVGQADEAADKSSISFVADPKVQRGGCLLQTARGTVESSIDGQLEEIGQALENPE